MASKEVIQEELDKLRIAYPQQKMGEDQAEALVLLWAEEDFRDMPDPEFIESCRVVRRRCKWFPTAADIYQAREETARNSHLQPPAHEQLPERPSRLSDQEVARNKKEAGRIIRMLGAKKAM